MKLEDVKLGDTLIVNLPSEEWGYAVHGNRLTNITQTMLRWHGQEVEVLGFSTIYKTVRCVRLSSIEVLFSAQFFFSPSWLKPLSTDLQDLELLL